MNHRECMTLIMAFSDAYIHVKGKVGTVVTAECQLAVLILILYFFRSACNENTGAKKSMSWIELIYFNKTTS